MYGKLIKGQASTLCIAGHTISSNDLSIMQNSHDILKIIGVQAPEMVLKRCKSV